MFLPKMRSPKVLLPAQATQIADHLSDFMGVAKTYDVVEFAPMMYGLVTRLANAYGASNR